MKFTALPVRVGDSFLLRAENKIILVDGGRNKGNILELLRKEKIPNNHIDLLICTHYDADHINGIIGILKEPRYSFKEIWLPEILGSIGYTLSKSIDGLFGDLRNDGQLINDLNLGIHEIDGEFLSGLCSPKGKEEPKLGDSFYEKIDNEVLRSFNRIPISHSLQYLPFYSYKTIPFKIISRLKLISSLVCESLGSGAHIRWLKYQGKETHNSYGFDMICENAVQTGLTRFSHKLFFKALYQISLSKINKYSLALKYQKENVPNVLFTADSDLSFYSQPQKLKNNSIVTAPHHGSSNNDKAYNMIKGKGLIFVRSDQSQLKRPGAGYLRNERIYCTICKNITTKKKVEFDWNGNCFSTIANKCICNKKTNVSN